MKNSGKCPKCGSKNLLGPHKVSGESRLRIRLPSWYTATLEAIACADCGYTELYSDQVGLDNLRQEFKRMNSVKQRESTFQEISDSSDRRKDQRCTICGTKAQPGSEYCRECGRILDDE